MSETTQLELTQPVALKRMDPMEMIQRAFDAAIASGSGLEVVDRILAQQREAINYNDRVAFHAALRRIQNRLKKIPKHGWNSDTRSNYALAGDVDAAIDPLLQDEGMVLSFEPRPSEKAEEVLMVGILSLGAYSKEYVLPMPADGKGAKGGGVMSRTHATGSAITYGKRYLKDMIFNLSFCEKDDDGNAAGKAAMDGNAVEDFLTKLRDSSTVDELTATWKEAAAKAKAIGDSKALTAFTEAAGKRKNAILKGGAK